MDCTKCGCANESLATVCTKCGEPLKTKLNDIESTMALSPIEVEEECRKITIPATKAKGPILMVKKGPFIGQNFDLKKNEITLGRDPSSDIFLDDVTVSRHHARIIVSDDSVSIVDVGSLNGTYVNHELIEERQVLFSDDELQIGKFKLVFRDKK
ncbi:MAG TPA: FHA domain-containing protein [Candidatus Aquicultor sp.]|jgi:hypothetical protein